MKMSSRIIVTLGIVLSMLTVHICPVQAESLPPMVDDGAIITCLSPQLSAEIIQTRYGSNVITDSSNSTVTINNDGTFTHQSPYVGTSVNNATILTPGAVFRLYNPNTSEHFYTRIVAERDFLMSVGWNYEGEIYTAPGVDEAGAYPVYRFYDPLNGVHTYSIIGPQARALAGAEWTYECIAFYAFWPTLEIPGTVGVYYVCAPGTHSPRNAPQVFTSSQDEIRVLTSLGWLDDSNPSWKVR